jgi:hypothetical protein
MTIAESTELRQEEDSRQSCIRLGYSLALRRKMNRVKGSLCCGYKCYCMVVTVCYKVCMNMNGHQRRKVFERYSQATSPLHLLESSLQ